MSNRQLVNEAAELVGQINDQQLTAAGQTAVTHLLHHTPLVNALLLAQRQNVQHIQHRALIDLRDKINETFNLSDLKQLCFVLQIPYENLGGAENKSEKALALVEYGQRYGRLAAIADYCRAKRGHTTWPIFPGLDTAQATITPKANLAVVVDLASRFEILTDVADYLDDKSGLDANFVWFKNPNESRDIGADSNWNAVATAFAKAVTTARKLTHARHTHFFLAGPGPILFIMGCMWGSVKKATVYHLSDDTYHPVITISRKLHE